MAEPASDFCPSGTDKPFIISVGRLVATKDFPTLIRAFAQVRREVPSRLLILGEGGAAQ